MSTDNHASTAITSPLAAKVWQVLVEECGRRDDPADFRSFAYHFPEREWRFCGALGFGGKVWCSEFPMRVSCYPEDETPERLAMIERANARLAAISNGRSTDA